MNHKHPIALGLGGNIGDVILNMTLALDMLNAHNEICLDKISSYYHTPAWGEVNQPDFVNICAIGSTSLTPSALLNAAKEIESEIGRTKTYRWGPRIIDIDIILYGNDDKVDIPALIIPHKEMTRRAFVLVPLAEIAPEWLAHGKTIHDLKNALPDKELSAIKKITRA